VPDIAGNLLTYTAYIPKTRPAAGYGTFVFLPGYAITPNDSVYGRPDLYQSIANRPGNETIVADIAARGADEWFYGQSGASVFEAWADLARHYKLDPMRTTMAGFSSGAYGANKLALQFPDAFGKAFICDGLDRAPSFPGINGLADTAPVDTVTQHKLGSDIEPLLPSRYDQPVMEWAGINDDFIPYDITRRRADAYAAGSYDYEFISWTGLAAEHLTMCNDGTFSVLDNWLGSSTREVNPARVEYVRDPAMDDPADGMVGDHAYWLSHIEIRSPSLVTGTIDVFSKGLGQADRVATPPTGNPVGADPVGTLINAIPDPANLLKQIKTGQPPTPDPQPGLVQQLLGALKGTSLQSVPSDGFPIGLPQARTELPFNFYLREYRHYGAPAAAPPKDELDIDATNISTVTIDPQRAKVTCNAAMVVHSDGPLTVKLTGCPARHFS
jgi:pimeloyl-ACP methyl ester carboxylesterase